MPCFVQDVCPQVSKLDLKSLKCIFVGYSRVQKGYRCYCLTLRRYFVSTNVIFFETTPFSLSSPIPSQVEDDDLLVYTIASPAPTPAPIPVKPPRILQSLVQYRLLRHQIQSRMMIFRLLSIKVNVSVLTQSLCLFPTI